jgi:hypothetical protein
VTQTFNVPAYWDRRYRDGRTSGAGSEGDEGSYKAKYVSEFIAEHDIVSVLDWGCGDGQVLRKMNLPEIGAPNYVVYTGVDVSSTIIKQMRREFPFREFYEPDYVVARGFTAELALSMDVLFHFPDDADFNEYVANLFGSATRYVIIYSTNYALGRTSRHVMRREFTPYVARHYPEWNIINIETPLGPEMASFFVYEKEA